MILINEFHKQIYKIFTLKSGFQIIDILFKYLVIKMLSVADIGVLLYVCSAIYFLSNTSVMGMFVYLQRQVAREETINFRYIIIALMFLIMSSVIIILILPVQVMSLKPYFILIILCNSINTMISAVCNGAHKYDSRYKILLISSGYMIFMIFYMMHQKTHYNLDVILYGWIVNSVIATLYAVKVLWSLKSKFKVKYEQNVGFHIIMINLILIYSVSMPYDFARFYDRYLLSHFFSPNLLGIYTFNCSMILAVYSLLVMPTIGICLSALSKATTDIKLQAKIMIRYYFYIILVFTLIFIGYVPFAREWLELLGFTKYLGTTHVFIYVFLNMFFYALTIPFIINMSIAKSNILKIQYCLLSVIIFNIPLLFIHFDHRFIIFLIGFVCAYFLHFVVGILLNYSSLLELSRCLWHELIKVVKGGRSGILELLTDIK